MRMLERRIARLERALVVRRLLARLRQSRRDIEVLERRRREEAKAQAARAAAASPPQPRVVPKPVATKPVATKPVAEPVVPRVPVVAEAQPPPPVESRAIEPEPAPVWPNYDPPEHMQIRPIRWVPLGERYVDDEKLRHPADEEYDPFAEFDEEA